MRSEIDIILARQHATLQHSIAELRRVLDEDDDWRALAALESVCEAAGGVSGQGWIARRQELTAALAANPIYCLHNELARALAVVSLSIRDEQCPEDVAGGEELPVLAQLPILGQQDVAAADLPRDETEMQGVVTQTQEPRRESIASRIATLAMPPLNASAEQSAATEPPAQSVVTPDSGVVEAATQSIVAGLAVPVPDDADSVPGPAPCRLDEFAIDADDAGSAPCDAQPSLPLPSSQCHNSPEPPALEPEVIEVETEVAPLLQSVGHNDEDAIVVSDEVGDEDDSADLDFDDFNEEDFEAEVSIVTRASPPQPETSLPSDASENATSDQTDDGADRDLETLEQRLRRLDRQSEQLLQPTPNTTPITPEDEDLERANKWLEMIRARRASAALAASRVLYTEFERSPVPAAIVPAAPPSITDALKAEPEWMQGLDDADALDIVGGIEAEVKIVQRRSPATHPPGPGASPPAATEVQRRPRPAPASREQAIEPAMPYAGGIEEASVEIVRHTGSVKAHHDDAALSPASENPKLNASRFIRALTGE